VPIHAEQRVVAYSPEQIYGLVADVERYPEFLPWCLAARIRKRADDWFAADLVIGFRMIRERFTSHVDYDAKEHTVDTTYVNGPFKQMVSRWRFLPHPEGCLIDFFVDFEFKSRLLQGLATGFFGEVVRRMVGAFEGRARKLYGPGRPPAPSSAL
jgi:coenzyme Q-binding protein COQ10